VLEILDPSRIARNRAGQLATIDRGLLAQPRSVSGLTPTRSPMRLTAWFNDNC